MSVYSLPQYKELSQENEMRTVVVEQGHKEELKTTLTPGTSESQQRVSRYPVTPPIAGHFVYSAAQTEQQDPLFCGCGAMWTIFFIGIFIGAVFTWWIGVFVGIFVIRQDKREIPGFIANLSAAIVATVILMLLIFGVL